MRTLLVFVNLGLITAFAATALATAGWDVFRAGNLVVKMDGTIRPDALPRQQPAPVFFEFRGMIGTVDRSHPPAIREVVVDIDRDGALDPKGLPACRGGLLEARDIRGARRACGDSIVGTGTATGEISFPEQAPVGVRSPVTFFNGGVAGGTTTIFVHAYITVPVPAAVVTTIKVRKRPSGPYGMRAVAKVPAIAGGSGSGISIDFSFGRRFTYKGKRKSYLLGSCPDGRVDLNVVKALFKDETGEGGGDVTVSGSLVRSCTPKG